MSVYLRRRKLPSGNTGLYLEVNQNGSQRREALHLILTGDKFQDKDTLRRAQAVRDKRATELLDRRLGPETNPRRKAVNFFDYAEDLLKTKGKAMRESLRSALDRFKLVVGDDATFQSITRTDIKAYRDRLLSTEGISPNTANQYLTRVRGIFNAAQKDEVTQANPCLGIAVKGTTSLPRFLALEELRALATTDCSRPHVKLAFLFTAFTGLRFSDCTALRWTNIREGNMELRIQKTRTPVVLPLSEQARKILQEVKKLPRNANVKRHPEDSVFNLPAISLVNRTLHDWGKAAKVRPFSTHAGRHSYATMLIGSGVDLLSVSRLLVHASTRQTQRYISMLDSQKQDAVKKLPTL